MTTDDPSTPLTSLRTSSGFSRIRSVIRFGVKYTEWKLREIKDKRSGLRKFNARRHEDGGQC